VVTVIQPRQGNAGTDLLSALNVVLGTIAQNQQAGKAEQLKLLEILTKQPGANLEPVAASQVQPRSILDVLFGGGQRTLSGAPTATVGNQAFTVGKLPMLSHDPTLPDTSLQGGSPGDSSGPITQNPMRMSNVPMPAAPPAPAPTAPPATTPSKQTDITRLSANQSQYADMAARIAFQFNLQNPAHFIGNLLAESSLNPDIENSSAGAQGIAQFMPGTAKKYQLANAKDPEQAMRASARYWQDLEGLFGGDPRLVAAAYNAGEDAVQKAGNTVPNIPETVEHVRRVLRYGQMFGAQASADAASGPGGTVVPPGAAQGKVAGPGAPRPPTATSTPEQDAAYRQALAPVAPAPQPPAAPVAPAKPGEATGPDDDRELQLGERRVAANPTAAMVPVPGVGTRSRQWASDYNARVRGYGAGLYATPENTIKYNEFKRQVANDLDKDELQLRQDVQKARDAHPGQEGAFKNVRSQAELAGILENGTVRSPASVQALAVQDLQSAISRAPRDATGTLTPAGAQWLTQTAAHWVGGYGVKLDVLKPLLDAAGVATAQDLEKLKAEEPVKTAATITRDQALIPIRTAQKVADKQALQPLEDEALRRSERIKAEENPFEGDKEAIILARDLAASRGVPMSQFDDATRADIRARAQTQRLTETRQKVEEEERTKLSFGRELPENLRFQLQGIADKKYGGDIRQAVASPDDMEQAKTNYLEFKAREAQIAVRNRPIGDAEKVRIEGLGNVKRVLVTLRDNFTPEDRATFVGLINRPIANVEELLGGLIGGAKPKDKAERALFDKYNTLQPAMQRKFQEFIATAKQAEALAFDIGGKQLTEGEKQVVFGFIPTVSDRNVGTFMQKLDATLRKTNYLFGVHGLMSGATAGSFPEILKAIDTQIEDMGAEMRRQSGQVAPRVPTNAPDTQGPAYTVRPPAAGRQTIPAAPLSPADQEADAYLKRKR